METKQQVLDLFEQTRNEFLTNCRWIAKRIAKENNGYVNIDQVREQVTTPQGVNPKVYGAVFANGEFERVGFVVTTRKTSHGRPISNWFWKAYKPTNKRLMNVQENLTLF